jgi:CheY-like chemotaxis protein
MEAHSESSKRSMPRPIRPRSPGTGPRILIVEDDADTRWVMCSLMRRMGFHCETASDGEEALELAAEFEPQAILMDLMMPVLDGVEATRRLKADTRTCSIPVLAVTGCANPQRMTDASVVGCVDCLVKPVDLQDLVSRLQRHMHS